jgi:hypothetical protein
MKKSLASNLFFAAAIGALAFAVLMSPPGGVRWGAFVADQASLLRKLIFLTSTYVWPALLSFSAISMFQLQFRLSSSGASGRVVFSVCVVASGAMLLGLRTISLGASSSPSYVLGMALGYTMMARLYAVRMRRVFNCVRIPWPVWRGDRSAVEEIHRVMQTRGMQTRMDSTVAKAA